MYFFNIKMKKFTQKPIDKELIIKSRQNLFIPYFINEQDWYEINTHSWFKCLVYKYKTKNRLNNSLCGVDIGCKNFISLYSTNGICYRIIIDEDKINNILKNDKIPYEKKDKKIRNMINELHIQTSRLICNSFTDIYIGQIYTYDKIDSRTMNTTKDNLIPILSHNKFLKLLSKYANKKKKNLYIVDESFTSKHCGVCGEIKNKFERIQFGNDSERRKYICDFCNCILHRDINAARCIIIKNYNT